MTATQSRLLNAAYWLAAPILCLMLYWHGLLVWFVQDDFAWLNLRGTVQSWPDFWSALFKPLAQGTVRPLSERLFFMSFYEMFGLHALPYRLFVFATMFAVLALLTHVARKVTGSRVVGLLTPLLWLCNFGLITTLTWTSAYNQTLCCFFLLLSLSLFIRHVETGRWRPYWLQLLTFIVGFGALELNVVYPALAALYALLRAPQFLWRTAPLFAISLLYTLLHRSYAPAEPNYYYRMYVDGSMWPTFLQYWRWALGPELLRAHVREITLDQVYFWTTLLTVVLLAYVGWKLWRREWMVLFGVGWFLLMLAPLLPLRNHVTEYYLMQPTIGLALLAAWGCADAWRRGWLPKLLAGSWVAVYVYSMTVPIYHVTRDIYWRHERARTFVASVAYAAQHHPGKLILLKDVDDELFWLSFFDRPFRAINLSGVFMPEENRPNIRSDASLGEVEEYFLPQPVVVQSLKKGRAVVYEADERPLREVTRTYGRQQQSKVGRAAPSRIEVGNHAFDEYLGPEWHEEDQDFRWMPRRATVQLAGPAKPGQRLVLTGLSPTHQRQGIQRVRVSFNGVQSEPVSLDPNETNFRLLFPVPPAYVGQPRITVGVEVDSALQNPSGETRELGLVVLSLTYK